METKSKKRREKCNDPSIIGKKYGRLTVIGFRHIDTKAHHGWAWDCKCDCGKIVYGKRPNMVKSGEVTSCGCFKLEQNRSNLNKRKTHGKSETRLYGIWEKMKNRCECETSPAYKNYGGRGIKICDEWHDFQRFYDWAMQNGYTEKLSIERVDVNGDYCPENCTWIGMAEQQRNKRNTRFVVVNGEKMALRTACLKLGLPYQAVHLRVTRYGMTPEEAISKPFRDPKQSMAQKCRDRGMPYTTVVARIKAGWTEERALSEPIHSQKQGRP